MESMEGVRRMWFMAKKNGGRGGSCAPWRVTGFALVCAALIPVSGQAVPLQADLERAAVVGAALLVCDISSGVGSHGWNHYVATGARHMMISTEAATEVVESRTREIITHLNRTKRLDEFCDNAREGRF